MKKSLQKNIKVGLVIALSLAIGIAFMPLNTSNVYATNFSDGKISGYKMSDRTYKSVTFVWNSYPGASGYEVYSTLVYGMDAFGTIELAGGGQNVHVIIHAPGEVGADPAVDAGRCSFRAGGFAGIDCGLRREIE